MRATAIVASMACVLLCTAAGAEITAVGQTLDWTDNGSGYYFWPPTEEYFDHPPYYRMSNEDWGWTHIVADSAPGDAAGIEAATLSILAWDVSSAYGEDDMIYANGTLLGMLQGTLGTWTTTSFSLPDNVLDALWRDGEVSIFMDIDRHADGHRVTLGSSTLTVSYLSNAIPEPATVALLGLGTLALLRRRRRL